VNLSFTDLDLGGKLAAASDAELELAPFGVVRMNGDSKVTLFNRRESEISGLSAARVLGKHFFEDVAPCTNNHKVAHRFDQPAPIDELVDYVFTYRLAPTPVKLRLIKDQEGRRYMLVQPRAS
jgi:photoactive yellow protein